MVLSPVVGLEAREVQMDGDAPVAIALETLRVVLQQRFFGLPGLALRVHGSRSLEPPRGGGDPGALCGTGLAKVLTADAAGAGVNPISQVQKIRPIRLDFCYSPRPFGEPGRATVSRVRTLRQSL